MFATKRTAALIAAIAFAIVAAAGTLWWLQARPLAVAVMKPQLDTEVRVFGIGTVEAQVVSKTGFQVAGKIEAINADQGDLVKAGTLLARLDDSAQRAKLMKSEANVKQAAASLLRTKAQRERAEISYQQKKSINARRQALVSRGAVSLETAEDAQAAEDIARGDLRLAEADVAVAGVVQDDAAAQRRLDAVLVEQHELRAPFDARIITRHKELGTVANAGEAVFTLIEPASVWVRAYIDEASAGGLQFGQTAFVRLRSEKNQPIEAEVVRIDQENDRTTEERRLYVRCRDCGPQHQFRYLGEQAEVEIVKRVIPKGLFIPLKHVDNYNGRSGTVWAIEDGRLARKTMQLGERLLDGRVRVLTDNPDSLQLVAESHSGLRVGRAAHAAR